MSERKVLNKYYPPDFDPTKIPKLRQGKNRTFNIRIMAPFNMRCNVCGEYIYKGKKFNSRKENVEDKFYLGLRIFRFYIKCPRCIAEISFTTDPENTDYELEAGATRNFEALRTAEKQAEKEMKEKDAEEANNPMRLLEKRTNASRQEMEMYETLEELRELNTRQATVDYPTMLKTYQAYEEQLKKLQEDEDEAFVQGLFGKKEAVKRLRDDSDEEEEASSAKLPKGPTNPTDILTADIIPKSESSQPQTSKLPAPAAKKMSMSSRAVLSGLVRKKSTPRPTAQESDARPTSEKSTDNLPTENSNLMPPPALPPPLPQVQSASQTAAVVAAKPVAVVTAPVVTPKPVTPVAPTIAPTGGAPSGLGLLGAYSDSDDSDES